MRMAASWIKKARSVTREVQSGINDMIRDADLEDARKVVQSAQPGNLEKTIGDAVDPSGSVSQSLSDVEKETRKAETEAKSAVKDGAASSAGKAPQEAKGSGEGATIIEQPTVIAPAHSLNPPPPRKPEPDPQAAPDTGGDGTQKRA
jgi:sec-independent protein translocase protein TatB